MTQTFRSMVTALLVALAGATAAAQPSFSPAMEQAIKAHVLTETGAEAVIGALREMTTAVVADPNAQKTFMARMKLPLEQQIQEMERDQASARILKASGLSAKDYTVGLLAMRAAAGGMAGNALASVVNPANVAFLKEHPDILQRFQSAERGQ